MTRVAAMRAAAATSIVGCLFVVLLYASFSDVRKKTYNKLILFICVSDIFGSIGAAIGTPEDGSPQCWIQAVLTAYFPLVSVFWTTVIAYLLYTVTTSPNSLQVFDIKMYALCFGVPALLTFLPLTTNTFGNIAGSHGWCFIEDRSDSPHWTAEFWVITSFYMWILAAIVAYIWMFQQIRAKVLRNAEASTPVVLAALRKLSFYPISLLVCWTLPAIIDIYQTFESDKRIFGSHRVYERLDTLSYVFPVFIGFCNSVAFISTNEDARGKLLTLLRLRAAPRDSLYTSYASESPGDEDSSTTISIKSFRSDAERSIIKIPLTANV